MKEIDLNCDMGESFGHYKIGDDQAIFPLISSCNIACGFHAGDPVQMERTVRLALHHGTQIGAHPGYPDIAGFGRRRLQMSPEELQAMIRYQVAALKGMAESLGGVLSYVKPHGALYNTMVDEAEVADNVIAAVRDIDSDLKLMGLAHSLVQELAQKQSMPFVAEAFADRRYQASGKLRSRQLEGAVISDPQDAAQQAVSIVLHNEVTSHEGVPVKVEAQSICIHGDNPQALVILKAIEDAFKEHGIVRKKFD